MQATYSMLQREAQRHLIEARDALNICIDMLGVNHRMPLINFFQEHEKFIDAHEKAIEFLNELIDEHNTALDNQKEVSKCATTLNGQGSIQKTEPHGRPKKATI